MTHKLLQLGHDVQNRRRVVGGLTTGSWVELCRYKRGLTSCVMWPQKGQGHNPKIFEARYLDNRARLTVSS